MARVLTKKSTVPGKVPLAADLEIGELAVNTADAKLFTKHSDNTIKQLGGDAASSFFSLVTVTAASAGQTSFTIPGGYTPGAIVVFLNGSSLAPAHYTATNGTAVVLQSGTDVIVGSELVVLRLSAFQVADALPLNGTAYNAARYGGILPPPSDGKQYALRDGAWVEVAAGSAVESGFVYRTTDLSTPNATITVVAWQAASRNDIWDSSAPQNILIPAGYAFARVTCQIGFAPSSSGERYVVVSQNTTGLAHVGSAQARFGANPVSANRTDINIVTGRLSVAQGDVLQVRAYQTSGGALSLLAGGLTWAMVELWKA